MEARTDLDSELRREGKDEGHVNGDAAKTTSVEERRDNQHVPMESENNMDGDGFDWEDGNIASCEETMRAHTSQWNGDLTIEVEDDDTSKLGKKRPIRRATARDKVLCARYRVFVLSFYVSNVVRIERQNLFY